MPDEVTTPVVHVDEARAGVPPIPVLPTAVAAFVGRTARGPVGEPRPVRSLAEFERVFGGLWLGGALGHAVRDYFLNGGTEAVVVRVLGPTAGPARAALDLGGGVVLEAADEGAWGNALRARVEPPPGPDDAAAARFTLTVRDGGTGAVEVFPDVCLDAGDPRRLDTVLAASALVRLRAGAGSPRPPATAPVAAGTDPWADHDPPTSVAVAAADRADDGAGLTADDFVGPQQEAQGRGLYALRRADLFTLLNIPPYLSADGTVPADPATAPPETVDAAVLATASALCRAHRAVLLVDPPPSWATAADAVHGVRSLGVGGSHVAVYFPRLLQPDPLRGNATRSTAPSGAVAGVVARADSTRGVRHPPAGPGAALQGTAGLSTSLTPDEVTALAAAGVNALQVLPRHGGPVVRGARTLDDTGSERAYLPVRRLLSTIGQSLERGLGWTVFEPNDEALWSTVRRSVEDYLQTQFRGGAFAGTTPDEAYFVRCDRTTMTQADLDAGRLVCLVGVAPLVPAEFVLLRVVQRTAVP